MQISDEMRAALVMEIVKEYGGGEKTASDVVYDALSALSLPVQPVAWEPYQIAICIGAEVRRRNRVGKDDEAGSISPCCELAATILVLEALHDCGILPATTPPVPPTKGPEDDLRAAWADGRYPSMFFSDDRESRVGVSEYSNEPGIIHIATLLENKPGGYWKVVELSPAEAEQMALHILNKPSVLALRSRPASALPGVGERIKPLEWYPDPGAFPYNTWGAQSSFGRFIIEEVSASDSPAYEARYTPHHLITIKDSLEDAKAAAQADYERRILSALIPSVQP